MLFTEFQFLFYFLPLVLAIHALLPRTEQRLWFVFGASLFFYAAWDWRFLPLLVGTIAFSWWMGDRIGKSSDDRYRKKMAAMAIVVSLLPLAYFKYSAFVAGTFDFDAGWKGILPLGISFFTFQQITYVVNIYKRRFPASKKFIDYAFVVTFFPHLIAGPILFFKDIAWQIGHKVDRNAMFAEGMIYFAIGFTKKLLIADNIALLVNPVFEQAATGVPSFGYALSGMLGYTLQLYFDFSGYSDMAVGLGLLLGYRLPMNFNSPYKAGSIIDFWRRWHMTLSGFLRDYVYIPLGGNRYADDQKWKWHRNLLLTMLVGGLWHGANWTFIAWGGLHGAGLVANHIFCQYVQPNRWTHVLGYPFTFLFVALGWVLFRAEDFGTAMNIYRGLLDFDLSWGWSAAHGWILLGLGLVFCANSHEIAERLMPKVTASGAYWRGFFERRLVPYILLAQLLWLPIIGSFYAADWDKALYRTYPIRHAVNEIDTDAGDYRSNLFTNQVFTGDEKKIVFVGSSYTRFMGAYDFAAGGERYKTGTLGMGGNYIFAPLRTASQVIDMPHLHTMVMAVSALNMTNVSDMPVDKFRSSQRKYAGAFPNECYERLNALGFNFAVARFGECHARDMSYLDRALIALAPGSSMFGQFHGFLQKMKTAFWNKPDADAAYTDHLDLSAKAAARFFSDFKERMTAVAREKSAPASKNGADASFKWRERGTLEAIAPGGDVYEALGKLAANARARGVNFILFTTPTVTHEDAPDIYPAGYYEAYQKAMQKLAQDHKIPYYDLSGLVPWRQGVMVDFIHTTAPVRKDIQKYLLYTLHREGYIK